MSNMAENNAGGARGGEPSRKFLLEMTGPDGTSVYAETDFLLKAEILGNYLYQQGYHGELWDRSTRTVHSHYPKGWSFAE